MLIAEGDQLERKNRFVALSIGLISSLKRPGGNYRGVRYLFVI